MKKKAATLIFAISLLSTSLFSQTIKEKIDKQIKDPKTAENSGKADVYIQKKTISDSGLIINDKPSLLSKKKIKTKKYYKKTPFEKARAVHSFGYFSYRCLLLHPDGNEVRPTHSRRVYFPGYHNCLSPWLYKKRSVLVLLSDGSVLLSATFHMRTCG